jgi:hypothetical protein
MRSLAVAFLTTALALPAAAAAASRRDGPPVRGAALIGFDQGDLDGVALRFDGEVDLQRLSPEVVLTGVGSLGYSHLSESFRDSDQTAHVFTAVPAMRLRLDVNPQTGGYADLGFGLWLDSVTTKFHAGGHADDSDVGLMARFGVGWYVWAGDNDVRFQVDASLSPHFGDYNDTAFQLLFGVAIPLR